MKRFLIAALLMLPVACSDSKDSDNDNNQDTTEETPAPVQDTFAVKEMTFSATDSKVWIYLGVKDGELALTDAAQPWIFGVSRWMWRTNTRSSANGTTTSGGAYALTTNFDDIKADACTPSLYTTDEQLLGYSVNKEISTRWADTQKNLTIPLDVNFIIARDSECIKLRVLTYDQVNKGVYTVKYQRLK